MPTDQELLDRVVDGDEAALAELYRRYYRRLARFLLRVTRDVDLVAEVINDVFLVVWQKGADFRGEASISSWILGIAYRRALKASKKTRSWETLADVDPAGDDPHVRRVELDSSLAQLSADHRAVVELAYFFGYSYREIGEILGCPENTVKTRMFHARRALGSILEV